VFSAASWAVVRAAEPASSIARACALLAMTVPVRGLTAGSALAVGSSKHCPPRADEGGFVPNGNANGGAPPNRDQKLSEDTFPNTKVQLWCVHEGAEYFYALLVDGVGGNAYRFVAKCGWKWGNNPWTVTTGAGGNLTKVTWESKDKSSPPGATTAYTGTDRTWRYEFDPATNSLTSTKFDSNGTTILKGPTKSTPSQFSSSSQLQGGTDPTECSNTAALESVSTIGGISLDPAAGALPVAQPSSGSDTWLLAEAVAGTAATAVVLGGAAWYVRKRRLQ
jgi:hypothetical protein